MKATIPMKATMLVETKTEYRGAGRPSAFGPGSRKAVQRTETEMKAAMLLKTNGSVDESKLRLDLTLQMVGKDLFMACFRALVVGTPYPGTRSGRPRSLFFENVTHQVVENISCHPKIGQNNPNFGHSTSRWAVPDRTVGRLSRPTSVRPPPWAFAKLENASLKIRALTASHKSGRYRQKMRFS